MIDIHSHILPDLDDGADDLEDALAMLRIAAADGVRTMVATPHLLNGMFPDVTVAEARARHELLVREAGARGVEIEILLGGEVHLDADILNALQAGDVLTMGTSRAILLELPTGGMPHGAEEVMFEIQTLGHRIALAHPERNHELMQNPDAAEKLRDRGMLLQVTARSVTGGFGRRACKVARRWLKRGVVDILASDAHNPRGRDPVLSKAARWVAKKHGTEYAEDLVIGAPARLLGLETA
jgi:protein-tyrosine phosphatase